MKRLVLTLAAVMCCLTSAVQAQIPQEYQGTYSQKLNAESMTLDDWGFEAFPAFDMSDFGFPNIDSLTAKAFVNLRNADSVMSDFFEGFDNFDTVIETDNGKMAIKSSSHVYSSVSPQGDIPDSLKAKMNEMFDRMQTQTFNFSSSNFPNVKAMLRSFGMQDDFNPRMSTSTYTQSSDSDGNTSSDYYVKTADGTVYTDKDIQIIISSNSIEEIIPATGETLYLISFDDEDVEERPNGIVVQSPAMFDFNLAKGENGELKYKKFGMIPFVLTKTEGNNKSLTEDNDAKLSIYPNPSHDVLNVALKDNIQKAELVNMRGQTVFSATINDNRTQIYTGNFEKGSYVLTLTTDKNTISKRVVLY